MVKLKALKLKSVKLDSDEADDCDCGNTLNIFDKFLVEDDDQIYVFCDKCGEIYKVKD
jgi:hypothetical protein